MAAKMMEMVVSQWTCHGHLTYVLPLTNQFQEFHEAILCGIWGILVIPFLLQFLLHTIDEVVHYIHHYHNFDPVSIRNSVMLSILRHNYILLPIIILLVHGYA